MGTEETERSASLDRILEGLDLEKLTPEVDTEGIVVSTREVNRPGFQLSGYFNDFVSERIMLIGQAEYNFISAMEDTRKKEVFERIFSYHGPCMIFTRGNSPDRIVIDAAVRHGVPLYLTREMTSPFMGQLISELGEALAPRTTMHGVLVDVYGEGVLIRGESGIGKSEAALELIRRGHRLVADDVVEIRRVNEKRLVGTAPEITRNLMEVRGIGIIDVKNLFGVECIKDSQEIDLVVEIEDFNPDKTYDRLGVSNNYVNILGLDVVCQSLPLRSGRNLAVILEVAAANNRQKKMGYVAADELLRRQQEKMRRHAQKRVAQRPAAEKGSTDGT